MTRKINTRDEGRAPKSIESRKIISSAKQMPPKLSEGIKQYETSKTSTKNEEALKENNWISTKTENKSLEELRYNDKNCLRNTGVRTAFEK